MHRYGLASQAQRSAASVPANIAEGFERRSTKDYQRFLAIACGSLAELETHIRLAVMIGPESDSTAAELMEAIREVGRIVRGIERGLGRKLRPGR